MGFGPIPKEALEPTEDSPAQSAIATVRYFGDYELLEQIGRGGMGVVFKASQISLRRFVALKMISAGELASPTAVQRFHVEAEAAAKLDHPNIVPIYEIGVHQGQHYFSMKLVQGGNLEERMAGGKGGRGEREDWSRGESGKGIRQAATLLAKIARAVHYAHQHGVLHRDLKPGNILLDAQGEPHLTDFGLAKILEHEIGVTRSAEVMGTPSYMSPEQAAGRQLSTAADLWSLGVILYELLTGRAPFRAENTPALLRKIAEEEPERFANDDLRFTNARQKVSALVNRKSNIVNSIDRDLETICLKCLEKDPTRRYTSAAALADDLEHWLRDEPILARRATVFERVTKWARRQPVLAAAVVLLHVVLALGLAGVLWQWRRADQAHRDTTRGNDQLLRALDQVNAIHLQRAEEHLAEDHRLDALPRWALVLRNNPANRLAAERLMSTLSHRTWGRLACPPMEHSNRVTHAMFSRVGTKVVTSSADNTACVWDAATGQRLAGPFIHSAEINTAVLSEDGRFVVTASQDKTARVWNVLTGAPVTEPLEHSGDVLLAGFSPDGERVLTISGHLGQIWSVSTGQRMGAALEGAGYVMDVRLSPDGSRLAMACAGGQAQLWDVVSGACLHHLKHANDVRSVAFSPDGKWLVTASTDRTARVWDVRTGQPVCDPLQHPGSVRRAEFSPEGQRIVTASDDHTAQIWDARAGKKVGPPMQHDGEVRSAVFSPEGLRVVTASWDKTVRVWDAITGQPLTEPMVHEARVFFAQFHPDGERVLTASNGKDVLTWQVVGTPALAVHFPNDVGSVEFSPDGKKIVVASDGANTRVWDPWSGRPLTPPLVHAANRHVNYAVFSPDGRRVATGSEDGTARIWNATDGQPVTKPLVHEGQVYYADFSPDGARLLTSSPRRATIWETENDMRKLAIPLEADRHSARFSPNGQSLLTVSEGGTARVWDSRTGEPVTPPIVQAAGFTSAEFSPDGRFVVTAAKGVSFLVWDARTGRRVVTSQPNRMTILFAFYSPSGKHVLTSTVAGGARLWDSGTGTSLAHEFGARSPLISAIFCPDGSRAMIAYQVKTLQLWDPISAERLSETLPHSQNILWGRCSADGRLLAVSSDDRKVTLWEAPPAALPVPSWLPELAEGLAGQRFNQQGLLEPVRTSELWAAQQNMAAWAEAHAPERGSPDPQQVGSTERAGLSSIASLGVQRAAAGDSRAPANAFYARWARWFLGDARTRAVLPSSPLTLPQYAESLIEQGTPESWRQALLLQPTNGVAMALIGRDITNALMADWMTRRAIELEPVHHETWIQRAHVLFKMVKLAEAYSAMDRAIVLKADSPSLWILWLHKGLALEKASRLDEAVVAYGQAIGFAGLITNKVTQRSDALLRRSKLLRRLGRYSEAQDDFLATKGLPPRPPGAKTHSIDLSAHVNGTLAEIALSKALGERNGYAVLRAPNGVDYYLSGCIRLDGTNTPSVARLPMQATNILVGERCRTLHFLHSCDFCMDYRDSTRLGAYVVRFADGERREIPIVYGEDLRSGTDKRPGLTRGTKAWEDMEDPGRRYLCQHAWPNPRPDVEIQSIDFVSARADCSPVLFAISAEP